MKVELIDTMGDDLRVVNAARVSFDKESDWGWFEPLGNDPNPPLAIHEGLSPADQKLIAYLARNNHWTPFSHVQITMRETVPIFVARQRFKHMVGFTYNEVSRRYVDDVPELYYPEVWRSKPVNAKQGSSDEIIDVYNYSWHDHETGDWSIGEELAEMFDRVLQTYRRMIEIGIAPEQARMILPQSMYTSYYVTGSLAAWARAYKLRSDAHAQKEIQDLAAQWNTIVGNIKDLHYSWEALTNN